MEAVGISADLSVERAELSSPKRGRRIFPVKNGNLHFPRLITNSDVCNAEAVLLHSRIRISDIRAYRSGLPLPQLGNFADGASVLIASGIQIAQILYRIYAQLRKLGRARRFDAF